ncbi:MAG: hypothetical protein CMG60_07145 [Candidatus Marinimicrobia bacterium]|nr:hypothetical protein [Candidatus Neomarinimicrobiota bacterium]
MNPVITFEQFNYIYCHSHRNLVGKILRKLSDLIIYLFNGNFFEVQLVHLLKKMLNKMEKSDSRVKYFYYLLCIKRFNANYIKHLADNKMYKAVEEKERWARFISNYSESKYEIKSAQDYLYLLGKYGLADEVGNSNSFKINQQKTNKSENSFYIYGPNSDNEPNRKYEDSTIVLFKDINFDTSHFKDSMMLLNWVYYDTKIKRDQEKRKMLLNKYGKIFVSSMYPIDDSDFPLSIMPNSSTLGGASGLGRALFNIIKVYGRCRCIIDGFDFYLKEETFANYYPTLTRKDNQINEKKVLIGIAQHDAVYNFLFVKEMLNHINVFESSEFLEYANMPIDQYIKKLMNRRNFRPLYY